MRNLKKILALVLALVMSMSLVSVAGAKYTVEGYSDSGKVAEEYAEAVSVLSGLGIFVGDDRGFRPEDTITRAEVATLIYRIVTGDTTKTCEGAKVYADYGKFEDCVLPNGQPHWAAGMINFCANQKIILGYSDTKFGPDDNITGYQAILMLLRAIGWDKNGESLNPEWRTISAGKAQLMGWLTKVNMNGLGNAATRQVVAELLFNAINTPQFTFTTLGGYDQDDNILSNNPNEANANATLGFQNFKLAYDPEVKFTDWGHPFHVWYVEASNVVNGWGYNEVREPVVAYDFYEAEVTYTEAVAECHVYEDLGLTEDTDIWTLVVNGAWTNRVAECDGTINALQNKKMIGAQGRLTEIFCVTNDLGRTYEYAVVMRDEFLAYVDEITPVEYDEKGHIDEYATMTLWVFDNGNTPNYLTIESEEDWTDYEVGQWLRIYANTDDATTSGTIIDNDTENFDEELYEILGEAEYDVGKQSAYSNKDAHKIEGKVIDDAIRYELDEAANFTKKEFAWFFDSYGNVLGSTEVFAEKNYATIKTIWWVDSYEEDLDGYAKAKIVYMDGEEETVKITHINGEALNGVEGKASVSYKDRLVASSRQYNSAFCNVALYAVAEKDGYVKLTETTKLDKATTAAGVPALNETFNADHSTKFLIYEKGEYTTLTGIEELPTYTGGNFWVVDERAPENYGEYVFIANPTRPGSGSPAKKDTTGTFFAFNLDGYELITTSELTNDGIKYWAIDGGYVDGKEGTLKILKTNESVKDVLEANIGKLMYATFDGDGFCKGLKVVENKPMVTTNVGNVVWVGTAGDLLVGDGVAEDVADNATYNTLGHELLSYTKKTLRYTNFYDDDANVYFVFKTVGTSEQKVTMIYITDETCVGAVAVPTTPADPTTPAGIALKAADDAIKAATDAIKAAEAALGITLSAEAADAHKTGYEAIEKTIAALTAAVTALDDIDVTTLDTDTANAVSAKIVALTKTIKDVKAALVTVAVDAVETATEMYEALKDDATAAEKAAVAAKAGIANTLIGDITTDGYVAAIDDTDNSVSEAIDDVKTAWTEVKEDIDTSLAGAAEEVLADAKTAAVTAMKNAVWTAVKADKNYQASWKLVKSETLAAIDFVSEQETAINELTTTAAIDEYVTNLTKKDTTLQKAVAAAAADFVSDYKAALPTDAAVVLELVTGVVAKFEGGVLSFENALTKIDENNLLDYLTTHKDSVYDKDVPAVVTKVAETTEDTTKDTYKVVYAGLNKGDEGNAAKDAELTVVVKNATADEIAALQKVVNEKTLAAAVKTVTDYEVETNTPTEANVLALVKEKVEETATDASVAVALDGTWTVPGAFNNVNCTVNVTLIVGTGAAQVYKTVTVNVNVTYNPNLK